MAHLPHGDHALSGAEAAPAAGAGGIRYPCRECGNESVARDGYMFTNGDGPICMHCQLTGISVLNRFEECGPACGACGKGIDGPMIMDRLRGEVICEGCRDVRVAEMHGR